MKRVFGYSRVHLDASYSARLIGASRLKLVHRLQVHLDASYSARLIGASRLKLVHQDAPYLTPEMAQLAMARYADKVTCNLAVLSKSGRYVDADRCVRRSSASKTCYR